MCLELLILTGRLEALAVICTAAERRFVRCKMWAKSFVSGRPTLNSKGHHRTELTAMKRATKMIIVVLLGGVGEAGGVVHEFDLPELTGGSDTLRTTSFEYDGPRGLIRSVALNVTGYVDFLGELECWVPPVMPDTVDWIAEASGTMKKPAQSWFHFGGGRFVDQIGAFDVIVYLATKAEALLSEGDTLEVNFGFGPSGYVASCTPITLPPTGVVVDVVLFIEVTPLTPVQASTWGRIKSLYRAHN